MKTTLAALLLLTGASLADRAGAAELVMVEQHGCGWCEIWNRDISPIYPKTAEGRAAPLRRINLHDRLPPDLAFLKGLHYTPTFVLVDEGREIGRIAGYPGEDFFWGLLAGLIDKLPKTGTAGKPVQTN